MTENKELQNIKKQIIGLKKEFGPHFWNLIKASMSMNPVGGTFVYLMDKYIPNAKFERIYIWTLALLQDVANLENKYDEECVKKDEFAYLFEQTYKAILENYQEEKLELFRNFLVNSLNKDYKDFDITEREMFFSLLKRLDVIHIKMLAMFNNPDEFAIKQGFNPGEGHNMFGDCVTKLFPKLDEEALKYVVDELNSFKLIDTDSDIFNTITTSHGVDVLKGRLTKFGERFINYCSK